MKYDSSEECFLLDWGFIVKCVGLCIERVGSPEEAQAIGKALTRIEQHIKAGYRVVKVKKPTGTRASPSRWQERDPKLH